MKPNAQSISLLLLSMLSLLLAGCRPTAEVVVYTSQDMVFAEKVFQRFETETGIKVKAVYDTESAKTVGLVNRLRAEKDRPRCEVFWSNEQMLAGMLIDEGVLQREGVAFFGYRSRCLVANTNLLAKGTIPRSLSEVTNPAWQGKFVMAYPIFGTTASHFIAMKQQMGGEAFATWCRALAANKALLVDGNSLVVRMVGSGQAPLGLTDWDDYAAAKRDGAPLSRIELGEQSHLIRNTVAFTSKPPTGMARRFLDFLTSESSIAYLVQEGALEGSNIAASLPPAITRAEFATATELLEQIFVRAL